MKKTDKEYCIEAINKILNSRSSEISKDDFENLVVLREKIKNEKTRNGIFKHFKLFLLMFGVSDLFDT